jgi:hypothetical protein
MNTSSFGVERGTLIRVPSTANLMIDSDDRSFSLNPSAWDFQITKKQSLLNGFFTRIGATEVVMEWCENNIDEKFDNNYITFDLSGTGANTFSGQETITLTNGNYTVYELLQQLKDSFNDISGTTGIHFVENFTYGSQLILEAVGGEFFLTTGLGNLVEQLGLATGDFDSLFIPNCPDLRPYRYLDFVCEQLTSVQDVKDSSTQNIARDTIVRWYFAEDVPEATDAGDYPILQGYLPFKRRRLYNPPKQIKWEQNLNLGNLRWSVYAPNGNLATTSDIDTNWLMTLQLSEG